MPAEQMRWGFPGFEKGKLLINARAETALERPTFGRVYRIGAVLSLPGDFMSGIRARRSLPLSERNTVLFMAGCYNRYEGQERFVILTTDANSSVAPVHNRCR